MKAIRFAFGSMLFLAFFVAASQAQVQRTFVSGLGNDGNPCTRTAPCRTLAQAISQTNSSGEVYVLDSAGYAAFTVTQPISIVAPPGVTAGISVFSGDGVDINASASDTVILKGLTINNQGSSGSGIVFNTGGTLHVESCVLNGFSDTSLGNGIAFNAGANLEVKDSIFRGNRHGILVQPSSGTALATIEQVRIEGGGFGLEVDSGSKVTVRNSIASGNLLGFLGVSTTSAAAELNVENCVVSNGNGGIEASMGSTGVVTVRVSNSTVTDNGIGLSNNTGITSSLQSRGNNTVEGNGTNTIGTIGSYTAK